MHYPLFRNTPNSLVFKSYCTWPLLPLRSNARIFAEKAKWYCTEIGLTGFGSKPTLCMTCHRPRYRGEPQAKLILGGRPSFVSVGVLLLMRRGRASGFF